MLTSLLKRHDLEFEIAVDRFFAGELEAGTVPVTMTDGIYALSTSGGHLGAEERARLDGLADDLSRGAVSVSNLPLAAPTMLPAADQTVRVELRGDECIVDQTDPIFPGTMRVEFWNSNPTEAVLRVFAEDLPDDAIPEDAWTSLGLVSAPGGNNAGVIRVTAPDSWTIACESPEVDQVIHHLLVAPPPAL